MHTKSTTPLLFQQPQDPVHTQAQEEDRYILNGQNTRFSQVSQKQTAYLPDGIPSFRMQIPCGRKNHKTDKCRKESHMQEL